MSLHINSDYEIISDAEVSSVISKYSPNMIDMTLNEILRYKGINHTTPLGNLVSSYETNLKIDMEKFPQYSQDMLERRAELYTSIMDKVCSAHNLSYQLPSDADIYTSAFYVYQFLVSGFYQNCITFFVNFLTKEADEICKMTGITEEDMDPIHQYAKRRYNGKSSLALIHTNLNMVLDAMNGIDISLYDIINTIYTGSSIEVAGFLNSILVDDGDFYKQFYMTTVSGYNRPEAVTNIRLRLMPITSQIVDFIETEGEIKNG